MVSVSSRSAAVPPPRWWFPKPDDDNDVIWITAAGIGAWGAVHAASCALQGALLGVSTGTRPPVPTALGLATVVVASWAAHSTAVCTQLFQQRRRRKQHSIPESLRYAWQHRPTLRDTSRDLRLWGSSSSFFPASTSMQPYWHTLRLCLVGWIGFSLLGGRLWAVAPSSYTHLGSFARGCLPATEQYATPVQRQAIERLGRLWGCHTCGSRQLWRSLTTTRTVRFIGDHQPPKAVAYQMNQQWWRRLLHRPVAFRFYPQCVTCSHRQGGLLAAATLELGAAQSWNTLLKRGGRRMLPSLHAAGSGRQAYVHGLRPRLHWAMGGLLGHVATAEGDQGRARYQQMQTALDAAWERPPVTWLRTQWARHVPPHHRVPRWYRGASQRRLGAGECAL